VRLLSFPDTPKSGEGGIAMMGRLHWMIRRLVAAMLMAYAASLAGLNPSHAAAANSSGADVVNGMPCNDLCKTYLAWSNRMAARFSSSRPQTRSALRTAARPPRPERPPHHRDIAETHRSGLNSFAQLPRPSDVSAQSAAPRQAEMVPSQPDGEIASRPFPADGGVAEQRADTGSVATEFPETMPVADPIAATQQPITSSHIAAGPPLQLPLSLVLALGALLAFGCWGWIRGKTDEAASAIQ
jgi:hypothetical protein